MQAAEDSSLTEDSLNPINATKRGQEALQDILSGLRDLVLPFYACMDPKNRSFRSTHQVSSAAPKFLETIQQIKTKREVLRQAFQIVKKSSERSLPADTSDIIPYVDSESQNNDSSDNPGLASLLEARENAKKRLSELTDELEELRGTLTTILWELNDLLDPTVQKC